MITRVQIKNFRSIAVVDVELGPLNVLVGPNGAGKSSLVDALRFVRDAVQTNLTEAVKVRRGMEAIRRWSPYASSETEIALTLSETYLTETFARTPPIAIEYAFAIASEPNGDFRVSWERGSFSTSPTDAPFEFHRVGDEWVQFPATFVQEQKKVSPSESRSLLIPGLHPFASEPVYLSELLMSGYYDIAPQALRLPQLPAVSESLDDHGENLASVLQRLCANEAVKLEILAPLRNVIKGVSDIRVQRVGDFLVPQLNHADIAAITTGNGDAAWFPLNRESDGTLRLLALAVALNQRTLPGMLAPRLIAVEEPETALHPGALAVLHDELRAAAYRYQMLVTTQSPDLITHFNLDELRIVERINGVTHIGPLDEIQRGSINEQLFTTGDLLRIEGLRGEPIVFKKDRHA